MLRRGCAIRGGIFGPGPTVGVVNRPAGERSQGPFRRLSSWRGGGAVGRPKGAARRKQISPRPHHNPSRTQTTPRPVGAHGCSHVPPPMVEAGCRLIPCCPLRQRKNSPSNFMYCSGPQPKRIRIIVERVSPRDGIHKSHLGPGRSSDRRTCAPKRLGGCIEFIKPWFPKVRSVV